MATAFAGFEDYIEYLATGKLDGYLDSIQREDKNTDLKVDLNLDPILLLHDLGKHVDQKRVECLFIKDTTLVASRQSVKIVDINLVLSSHLFSVSYSGKTRFLLDGLCQNWSLYISCRTNQGLASGSDDFTVAMEMLQSTWNKGESSRRNSFQNSRAADRACTMLLCARFFILRRLVLHLPVNTDAMVARRRWVLAQVLPPRLKTESDDLFVKLLWGLRHADIYIMEKVILSTIVFLNTRPDMISEGNNTTLYLVIDDAQVAAHYLEDFTTGPDLRPIFREIYRFFDSGFFNGIIFSGTALSMKIEDRPWEGSAVYTGRLRRPRVITDIGRFTRDDPSQVAYIRRYLTLSENDVSDRRLLERMTFWFSGRYVYSSRLTLHVSFSLLIW